MNKWIVLFSLLSLVWGAKISEWTFEIDGHDSIGNLNGTLEGDALIQNGVLTTSGNGVFRTGTSTQDIVKQDF